MTANGSCNVCQAIANHYISSLKEWRCDEHRGGIQSQEDIQKMKSITEAEFMMIGQKKKKPGSNKDRFGKRYF